MKLFVIASDKYRNLMGAYGKLLAKYWPGQTATILCYAPPNIPLGDNCEVVSLGKQSDFGKYWTNGLIPFFSKLKEDYFIITVDDMLLMDYVEEDKLSILEKEINAEPVQKAMIHSHMNKVHGVMWKPGILKIRQSARYRTTLHPAIWRKDYFLKYLKPNMTAWNFEVANIPESQKDGALVITLDQSRHIFDCINVFRGGKIVVDSPGATDGQRREEDIKLIKEAVERDVLRSI